MTNYTFEPDECRMCGIKTHVIVNIKMKAVAICNDCCDSITKQNVMEKCSSHKTKTKEKTKQ